MFLSYYEMGKLTPEERKERDTRKPRLSSHLKVRKSKIKGAGDGLFATKTFRKGKVLGSYDGEYISKKELNKRYPGDTLAEFTIEVGDELFWIDGKNEGNVMKYINDKKGSGKKANVTFVERFGRNGAATGVNVVVIRKVKKNKEFYVNYGIKYFDDDKEEEVPEPKPEKREKPRPGPKIIEDSKDYQVRKYNQPITNIKHRLDEVEREVTTITNSFEKIAKAVEHEEDTSGLDLLLEAFKEIKAEKRGYRIYKEGEKRFK